MNMREKIARAIERRRMAELGWSDDEFEAWWSQEVTNPCKTDAYAEADAVLDALMEPTEGMLEYEIDQADLHYTVKTDGELIFQAMIRAAKEGK